MFLPELPFHHYLTLECLYFIIVLYTLQVFLFIIIHVCSVGSTNPYSKYVRELKVKGDSHRYFDLPSFEDFSLGM